MSNDLIGKKLVYADDISRYIKTEINPYGKPFEGSAYEFGLKIMEYINNMSAAMTAEEAWEIAKDIICPATFGGFNADDANDIFGTASAYAIMQRFTPQQVKTKIEAWEAGKEIGIGDVVKAEDSIKAVALDVHENYIDVLTENGCAEEWYKSKVEKTGRHIDIQSVLEQIGGRNDG